ncbi:MAG: AmmeMemoRadiSam system protein B [Gemmataceae bacterium]
MPAPHRPQLRPYLAAARLDPWQSNGKEFVLYDRLRLAAVQIPLTPLQLECLKLFDGTRTVLDVQMQVMPLLGGQVVPIEEVVRLAEALDQALYLDSPRFRAAVDGPVRKACCLGVYSPDPGELRRQMGELFAHPQASGPPGPPRDDGRLRAVLAPHIDYHRGGLAYTFAFKELFESTPASLFVIIGTSHYAGWRRFTLTRKHFATPLGVVPTDQAYIDRLASHYGGDLFQDEWVAHLPEHSIELEVVFLHYLYERKRDIRIVPILVGSFEDCVSAGDDPTERDDLRRMVAALQAAERETPEPVCYVISGDLAHIGPKFGADHPLREAELAHSRSQDRAILAKAERADSLGYFDVIARERDARNICGLPPTWLALAATKPASGRLLRYDQYVDPSGYESVSFASVGFYR